MEYKFPQVSDGLVCRVFLGPKACIAKQGGLENPKTPKPKLHPKPTSVRYLAKFTKALTAEGGANEASENNK